MNLPIAIGISPTLKVRGILASEPIAAGQIIEKCPVILVDAKKEAPVIKQTVLLHYYYEYNSHYDCIVLGNGSLYNHSYKPNARYTYDFKNRQLVYRAVKNIKPSQEITINYNFEPTSQAKLDPEHSHFSN